MKEPSTWGMKYHQDTSGIAWQNLERRPRMKTQPDERGIIDHGGRLRLKAKRELKVGDYAGCNCDDFDTTKTLLFWPTHYTLTREFPIGSKRTLLDFTILADGRRV